MEVLVVVVFGILIWTYYGCRSYSMVKFINNNISLYGATNIVIPQLGRPYSHLARGPFAYHNTFPKYKNFINGT